MYQGYNYAAKFEPKKIKHPQLQYESKILKLLQGIVGIPILYHYCEIEDYRVMIIELLGPSLEDLFSYCNRKLSLKSVLMIAKQMIARISYVHSKGFIHRDIKPDNFLIGRGKNILNISIIDFGLAKRYLDPKTQEHIPFSDKKSLTGTARYASLHAHLGYEQGRRDDMESIGYILVYFLQGSLPWQGMVNEKSSDKYKAIKEIKNSMPLQELCTGLPLEFITYIQYCRDVKFDKEPDYNKLGKMFKDLFVANKFEDDNVYDWVDVKVGPSFPNEHISKAEILNIYKHINYGRKKLTQEGGELSHRSLTMSPKIDPNESSNHVSNLCVGLKPVGISRGACCSRGCLII